jgi:uncharacterized protein
MQEIFTAFAGTTLLASGSLDTILPAVKAQFDQDPGTMILIFEDQTGRQVDFDLGGSLPEVLARAIPERVRSGPGRPKLGVVGREVSLLPRHWEWLEQQPSGASAALRRLVDEARKRDPEEQRARLAVEATGRFLTAMAGDFAGYEEAHRALYRRNREQFEERIREWPADIRRHLGRLTDGAF